MAGYFTGGTGTLIFTASSLDTAVASVSISGSSLTITALKVGIATVTVNVTDAADDTGDAILEHLAEQRPAGGDAGSANYHPFPLHNSSHR